MRILYIDIDSCRPDHLGCYGYHRPTSPNIDRIAALGVRFTNCYVSDAPCLPSRASLFTGRFGIHTGVINHGGQAADPFLEGPERAFRQSLDRTGWVPLLRAAGWHTVSISTFAERHSAWWYYAGFREMFNLGKGGMESANEVVEQALRWLENNARRDRWFLHLHLWDPHTPYRAPAEYHARFADTPIPAWYTEALRTDHWRRPGPHSAQEVNGFGNSAWEMQIAREWPRQPAAIDSMETARLMFDGYDAGVATADHQIGRLLDALDRSGVWDETAILISSDHGEALGELNVYGDHQFADHITSRVPMILRWPGITDRQAGRVDDGLYLQNDVAATLVELVGQSVPEEWDARPFTRAFREGRTEGRPWLVVSHGAWTCTRGVRFDRYHFMRIYHDGYHGLPDVMLFDVVDDPHELVDLAPARRDLVDKAAAILEEWCFRMMRSATHPVDPMWTVLREGGPYHVRGQLRAYLERLRSTGRAHWANQLARRYRHEC